MSISILSLYALGFDQMEKATAIDEYFDNMSGGPDKTLDERLLILSSTLGLSEMPLLRTEEDKIVYLFKLEVAYLVLASDIPYDKVEE